MEDLKTRIKPVNNKPSEETRIQATRIKPLNDKPSQETRVKSVNDKPSQETRIKPVNAGSSQQQVKLQPGVIIKQRFLLQQQLGEGGMGVVFSARDLVQEEVSHEESLIAIKFLSENVQDHPEAFRLLQQECKKSQQLAHPNIVTVYDFDRDKDLVYLTMQLLSGQSLKAYLSGHEYEVRPLKEVEPILTDIVAGLSYAHQQGIVHSDLKPENIFLTEQGARIIDFGIARAIQQSDTAKNSVLALTPAYASLEMFHNEEPHARDDIFALACMSYQLLAGKHPFSGKSTEVAYQEKLEPKRIDGLSDRQWQGLLNGLSFDCEKRQQTAEEFLQQLLPKRLQPWKYFALTATIIAVFFALYVTFKPPVIVAPSLFENPQPEQPLSQPEQQLIDNYLEVAEVHMMVGRLVSPAGSNALDEYQKILKLHPFDRQAIAGLKQLLKQIADQANMSIDSGDYISAGKLVTIGLEINEKHAALLSVKKRLSNQHLQVNGE